MNRIERSFAIAFNETMVRLGEHCRRLERAVGERNNTKEITHAAQNAASIWHAGRRACRRLAAETPEGPSVDGAREHLRRRYITLLDLLAQAFRVVSPPGRGELQRLRQNLTREMSRPLVDGDATERKRAGVALPTP